MHIKTPFVLAMFLATASGAAHAQGAVNGEIRDLKGSVMVLKGKDYVNGTVGMPLATGDRVLVLEKAQAKVVLASGGQRCEIDLKENQALTVTATECKALVAAVQTVPGAGAPGSAAVAAGNAGAATTGAAASGAVWVGGAAAIAGGVYLGTRNKASGD